MINSSSFQHRSSPALRHPGSPAPLLFLKLGGSLITDKHSASTARLDILQRASAEIAAFRATNPDALLLLGHGSGSFGHIPAKKYNTRAGVKTEEEWLGFVEVWQQANGLNYIVMDALRAAGLPAVAFPPSAMVTASDGAIASWNLTPIGAALDSRLLPVVFGDVAFDRRRGGTILSTEDLFVYLAKALRPQRILLAGDEQGVYADSASDRSLIPELTLVNYPQMAAGIQGASVPDVTGGMRGKVEAMLALVGALPECEVCIFSGLEEGNIEKALNGDMLGTLIRN